MSKNINLKKPQKMLTDKQRENLECRYCGSRVATRVLDTLSVKGEPIKEVEANCLSCTARYII